MELIDYGYNELSRYLINKDFPDGQYTFRHINGSEIVDVDAEVYTFVGDTRYDTHPVLGSDVPDECMLMLRYEGDLQINKGVVMTPQVRKKGMMIYVEGDCFVDGTISMTARGAKAEGQNLAIIEYAKGKIFTIPAIGADGGARTAGTWTTNPGKAGVNGQTGGGGSGQGRTNYYGVHRGGAGAAGTSYSGGAGGGGNAINSGVSDGEQNGGAGGNGLTGQRGTWGAGGGAGNPGGTPASPGYAGETGTGGLLILIVKGLLVIGKSGAIQSNGSKGGGVVRSSEHTRVVGGGSGGGSVNVFYGDLENIGVIEAKGGLDGWGSISGGNGSVTLKKYLPHLLLVEDKQDIKKVTPNYGCISIGSGPISKTMFNEHGTSEVDSLTIPHTKNLIPIKETNKISTGYLYKFEVEKGKISVLSAEVK